MKIAIASDKGQVTDHFGHCEEFIIYDIENNKVNKREIVANPGHKPGFLPNFLNDLGIDIIISGGMGGGAIDIFNEKGIKVIIGIEGSEAEVIDNYLAGALISTGNVCDHNE